MSHNSYPTSRQDQMNHNILHPVQACRLFGYGDVMRALIARIHTFAPSRLNLLIHGETGTGKEICAEAIHHLSNQHDKTWVAVNCAALPDTLLMAELFGCAEGAFTDARAREGLIYSARGGTLFLDEVAELSLEAQAALLRVIETGQIRPLGSDQVLISRFRLICATHKDLKKLINDGLFRADLYHRIACVTLEVPPLRERPDDLPALIAHFAPILSLRLSSSALNTLLRYAWPGNVRELKNVLSRIEVECPVGQINSSDLQLPTAGPWIQLDILEEDQHQEPLEDSDECGSEVIFTPEEDKFLVSGPPIIKPISTPPHPPTTPPPSSPSPVAQSCQVPHLENPLNATMSPHTDLSFLLTLIPTMTIEELNQHYITEIVRRSGGNISRASRWLNTSRNRLYRWLDLTKSKIAS